MRLANNPIDTAQQREHELLALELFNSPELERVRAQVRDYWLDLAQPSPEMRSCFAWAFEEVMFGAVTWALNQDPLYPKVITITRLPHEINGMAIPYAVIGDQSSGLKSRQRSCPYAFVVPGSSV